MLTPLNAAIWSSSYHYSELLGKCNWCLSAVSRSACEHIVDPYPLDDNSLYHSCAVTCFTVVDVASLSHVRTWPVHPRSWAVYSGHGWCIPSCCHSQINTDVCAIVWLWWQLSLVNLLSRSLLSNTSAAAVHWSFAWCSVLIVLRCSNSSNIGHIRCRQCCFQTPYHSSTAIM